MAVNKRLLQGAAAAPGGLVPSEHFGVVLYEGDGSSSHSINGGKFGAGAYFAGSGNITPSGLTSEQLGPNGEMSISWWMNTPINDTTVAFICEGDTDSVYMVHLGGSYTRGMKVSFVNGQGTNELEVNNAFTANTWQHFVAVMTPTGNKLYRDGSLIGSNTFSFTRDSFSTFYIGSRRNSSLRFEGKLDQLRIFAKELSSSEVSTLYAETAATVESLDPLSEDTTDTLQVLGDSSCIATYRFENDEVDLSGNYDGTGTEIQYAAGRYGQAASFNGSSSGIDLPNLGISGSQSRTVSFWCSADSTDCCVEPGSDKRLDIKQPHRGDTDLRHRLATQCHRFQCDTAGIALWRNELARLGRRFADPVSVTLMRWCVIPPSVIMPADDLCACN